MPYCQECGSEVVKSDNFCISCGAELLDSAQTHAQTDIEPSTGREGEQPHDDASSGLSRRQIAAGAGAAVAAGGIGYYLVNDRSSTQRSEEFQRTMTNLEDDTAELDEIGTELTSTKEISDSEIETARETLDQFRADLEELKAQGHEVLAAVEESELRIVINSPTGVLVISASSMFVVMAGFLAVQTAFTVAQSFHLMGVLGRSLVTMERLMSVFNSQTLQAVIRAHMLVERLQYFSDAKDLADIVTDTIDVYLDQNPGVREQIRRDVLDVLDAINSDSATPTEETTTDTETETSTDIPTTVTATDGFEDRDLSEFYGDKSFASVQNSYVINGEWTLKTEDGGVADPMTRSIPEFSPETIEVYVRATEGLSRGNIIYQKDGERVVSVNHDMKQNAFRINGNTLASVSPDTTYHVVLDDIDWEDYVVGLVYRNDDIIGQDISFHKASNSVDEVSFSQNSGSCYPCSNPGDWHYWDDYTIPSGADQESSEANQEGDIGVDGFEDGDISEYSGQTGGFQVQQSVVKNGNWALKGQVQSGDNQEIYRSVNFSHPSRVQGYVRVGHGGGNENAQIFYHADGPDGSHPIHIDLSMNHGNSGFGDTSGEAKLLVNGQEIMDIVYDEWYFVELNEINWNAEIVGKVSVDRSVKAENVAFEDSASSIDTISFRVNDWGDEPGWFDDVSVGASSK